MKTRLEAAKPLLWLGAIVLAGVLLIALVRGTTEPDAAGAAQAPATTADAVPASSPPQPAAAAAATDTPPWMAAAPAGAQGPNAAARTGQAAGQPAPDAATVAQAVVQVREQAARNERNADELLRQIDAMKASGQAPPGVNLDALRNNLLVSKRAQALAREVAELTQKPETAGREQRIQDIPRELQQLQSQLRYDVGGPGAAPAPSGGSR
ncbi:hypothetical protein CSC62_03625 [Pseudoxanthomonas jiangsuensis]|uniref:hypothetical protein n=1 Tax=Pseudoxanthomonas jiangsuensis TaxID=619688 RepID=UPI001391A667|nr:hypothetical protein [Pseudoxanthomonas jiangsuensis]KAF1698653.1 hypothetical protein CSC62_03625 [Pseudoxanthomonas jiangsuensis]